MKFSRINGCKQCTSMMFTHRVVPHGAHMNFPTKFRYLHYFILSLPDPRPPWGQNSEAREEWHWRGHQRMWMGSCKRSWRSNSKITYPWAPPCCPFPLEHWNSRTKWSVDHQESTAKSLLQKYSDTPHSLLWTAHTASLTEFENHLIYYFTDLYINNFNEIFLILMKSSIMAHSNSWFFLQYI